MMHGQNHIKFLIYMFRPSRGHLQADIWNTLGSK